MAEPQSISLINKRKSDIPVPRSAALPGACGKAADTPSMKAQSLK
ncbi:hypothetical protein BN135_2862 [Cronobacter muytjensii 530]